GERLPFAQEDIRWHGHALECRIYAEDPDNQFFPSPGKITRIYRPVGPGIRIDSGAYAGWTVPMEYDPLLAKMAVWAEDRPAAVSRMLRALEEYSVGGIKTNVSFFRDIFADECFQAGELHTGFIDEFFARRDAARLPVADSEAEAAAALVALLHTNKRQSNRTAASPPVSKWKLGRL
ncbi:MAG TPA: acetyl-CoA carboxylase biotin carboxylase subunit, partial [Bryobacteraceae bacterium]|nr:acetyl-CoA carboxylase biotin carboxylase subunit [Bryobacteraceae bacterium]